MKFLRLVRFEMSKLLRMRLTKILLGILFLETCMKAVMIIQTSEFLEAQAGGGASILSALFVTSINACTLMSLVFASLLVSGEYTNGSLRYICSLPFSRGSIIGSKFFILAGFILAALTMTGLVNLALAQILVGIDPIEEIDYVVFSQGQIVFNYLLLYLISFVPVFAQACFGLLVSTWSTSSGAAVGITIISAFSLSAMDSLMEEKWFLIQGMRYSPAFAFHNIVQGVEIELWPELKTSFLYSIGYFIGLAGVTFGSFVARDNYT